MNKRLLTTLTAAYVVLAVSAADADSAGGFVTFDAPGAGTGAFQGTGCFAYPACSVVINAWGTVTGYYLDANNVFHGFVRTPQGRFTTFESPGADTTPGSFNGTLPFAINDVGTISGFYSDLNGAAHGFVRSPEGTFKTFDVPGGSLLTIPVAMNLQGSVVGSVLDQNAVWHGFLRSHDGTFKVFSGPGGCDTSPSTGCTGTGALSINVFGTIVGGYADDNFVLHGLLRSGEGRLMSFDVPGAGAVPGSYQGTNCLDCSAPVNQWGAIAGYYVDAANVVHGYLRSPRGEITTFEAPPDAGGQGFGCAVDCSLALNDEGMVTGIYLDANNVYRGFIRSPRGKLVAFDAPGADATPGSFNGTFPVSINDQGVITGYYLDAKQVNHGFLRFPAADE